MKLRNNYFILRHGETTHQIEKPEIIYFWPEDKPPARLTKKGEKQIQKVVKKLKNEKIDLIFSSDILRTRQTAGIVAEKFGLKINLERQLHDVNMGVYQGKPKKEFYHTFSDQIKRFKKGPFRGESWNNVKKRLISFLKNVEKKHKNKNILVVGHGEPLWLLSGIIKGLTNEELIKEKLEKGTPGLGELRKL